MILIDSSAWLGTLIERDQYHAPAKTQFESLIAASEYLLTTDYILDESYTLIRSRSRNFAHVRVFDETVHETIARKLLTVYWTEPKIFAEARQLFLKYSDQDFSFTDCVSFAVALKLKIKRIFTFDRDFRVMGFEVIPAR